MTNTEPSPDDEQPRVLHVTTDEAVRARVVRQFAAEQPSLDVVPVTAETATDHLGDVDCVLSDYVFPETDGLALLRTVRTTHPELPFVLYTAAGSEAVASEAISAGVTDYVQQSDDCEHVALLARRVWNLATRYRTTRTVDAQERRFRKLVEHSSDVVSIVDANGVFQYVSPASRHVFGYDPDLAPPEPDPEAARALLAEAGWADGLEVVLEHRHGRDPAPLVAQLARVGIGVTPVGRPWDEMFRRLQSGTVDFYFGGMLAVSADASDIFDSMVHTRDRARGYGQNNWLGFADPELDGLIEQSGTTLDMRARRAVLEQAMGVLMDRLPYVPLFYNHEVFAVRRGVVFEPRLDGMIRVHEIQRGGG